VRPTPILGFQMFPMLKPSDMKKIHPPPVKLDPQQHLEQKAKMIWCLKLAFRCSSTLICTRIHTVICSFQSVLGTDHGENFAGRSPMLDVSTNSTIFCNTVVVVDFASKAQLVFLDIFRDI